MTAPLQGRHDRVDLRRPVARINRPATDTAPPPRERRRLAVGLLGGSFNPAHEGHRQISLALMRALGLDRVWWLVSPQNPLKPSGETADMDERIATARQVSRHPRIVVSDAERRLGTRFTVDTLSRLVRRRGPRFVWLIGADNLVQMPRWRGWRRIFGLVPVAIVDREPYSYAALGGLAASAYRYGRLPAGQARRIAASPPPAWIFLRLRRHPASSTAIRRGRNPNRPVGIPNAEERP
ncbi:nicotinate-nucleotide adenylyltransferase [Marinivivus vitaminiproducens]|uniref:nicotinate-nucleotide adenylyltransferase n=1 Tax=Marinivivus vitaminiproducens TaxID=3035935 RepID=UPI0027A81DAC|nr:nicotinate-nucleotide adenylyltransferase [Geminicoccaceae bacterium SCSIO 64248]